MVQEFLVWLLGPDLATGMFVVLLVLSVFTLSSMIMEGCWPWKRKK